LMKSKYKVSLLSVAMATIVLVSMAATAGVTAAQTVSTGGQVSVVYDGSGNQWLFAQSTAGKLVYGEVVGGSVATWYNVLGAIGSAPSAVLQYVAGANQVTVFARGVDGNLYSTTTTNIQTATAAADWSAVTKMSGTVAAGTGPVAVYNPNTPQTDVFFVDSATHQLMLDGSTTSGIFPPTGGSTPLGGYVTATPGAAVTSTYGTDVFVRGSQGAVYERMGSTGGFSGWTKFHDGTIEAGTGPTAVSDMGGYIQVYVTGTNLHMYSVYSGDDGVTWATTGHHGFLNWYDLGGVLTSSPSGVFHGNWFVVVRGADNNIWTNVNGYWNAPPPIAAP
jgi:hypothetical protein